MVRELFPSGMSEPLERDCFALVRRFLQESYGGGDLLSLIRLIAQSGNIVPIIGQTDLYTAMDSGYDGLVEWLFAMYGTKRFRV